MVTPLVSPQAAADTTTTTSPAFDGGDPHCPNRAPATPNPGPTAAAATGLEACLTSPCGELRGLLGHSAPSVPQDRGAADADSWIRTIQSKFTLLTSPCPDENKENLVAQQLHGSARL